MSKGPRLRSTRATERAGVREVTDFFETHNFVVQPVHGENDFGKDLYVDLTRDVDAAGEAEITGITCAVQVKAGPSYRTASGYQIPIDQHLHCWRDSTVPVIGVVHDPERNVLVWGNLTEHLRTREDDLKNVPIPGSSVLNQAALPRLESSIRQTSVGLHPLVQLWSTNDRDARQAVWDCMAFGRRDARVFKGLRASIPLISAEVLPAIARVLSSLTSHPDRYWSAHNWIEDSVRVPVRETFRWTPSEAILLTRAAQGEWERGTVGQDVTLLFGDDPDIHNVLKVAIDRTYPLERDEAWMLFCVYLHFQGEDAMQVMTAMLPAYPEFRAHPAFDAVVEHIEMTGHLAIAD